MVSCAVVQRWAMQIARACWPKSVQRRWPQLCSVGKLGAFTYDRALAKSGSASAGKVRGGCGRPTKAMPPVPSAPT